MFHSRRAEARARRGPTPRQPRPVFVDDSGRRRRVARAIGTTVGLLVLVHVTFVGLTFTGLPGLGGVDLVGLGSLTAPAGGRADVGTDPVEQIVPEAVIEPDREDVPTPTTSGHDDQLTGAPVATTTAPPTTTTAPATTTVPLAATPGATTTTLPGNGHDTAGQSPSSTVPDKGGPPTSHPRDQ